MTPRSGNSGPSAERAISLSNRDRPRRPHAGYRGVEKASPTTIAAAVCRSRNSVIRRAATGRRQPGHEADPPGVQDESELLPLVCEGSVGPESVH